MVEENDLNPNCRGVRGLHYVRARRWYVFVLRLPDRYADALETLWLFDRSISSGGDMAGQPAEVAVTYPPPGGFRPVFLQGVLEAARPAAYIGFWGTGAELTGSYV